MMEMGTGCLAEECGCRMGREGGSPLSGDPNTHRSFLCPGTPMPGDLSVWGSPSPGIPLPRDPPCLGNPLLGEPPAQGPPFSGTPLPREPPAWEPLCPGNPFPETPPAWGPPCPAPAEPHTGQGMQGDPAELGRGWRRPRIPPASAAPPQRPWGRAVPTGSQPPRPSAAPSGWGSPGTVPAWGCGEMLWQLRRGESRAAQYPSHISCWRAFYLSSF